MAIVDNKKLRFVKKGFSTISDAKSYATNGRVVFDSTHKVVCVDQQVYGGSTYKGTAMNHDQLVAFLSDPNNMPGYMYSIGFANEDNVTGGNWVNQSVDPATHSQGTYAGGAHPTQTQGAIVDADAPATGEYNTSYGVQQPAPNSNKGAIYGDDVDTPKVHEGLRNQITIEITSDDADAINKATGARINPNKFESGDLFIFTGSTWVVITGEDQVIDDINLWSWEGTQKDSSGLVRPVTRDGASSLEGQFYPAGNDDMAKNQAVVDAPIGKVDGIDLSLKLKNPTLTDGDLVAYNKVQIGNLIIPKGFKIPAGVFIEDIIRQMITLVKYPAPPTLPAMTTEGDRDWGVVCLGDKLNCTAFTAKASKGSYDGTGTGAASATNNWTDDSNVGEPQGKAVDRSLKFSVAAAGCTGGALAQQSGNSNGETNFSISGTPSQVTATRLGVSGSTAGVRITATFNGAYKRPTTKPVKNNGEDTTYDGKSLDEANIAHLENGAWWADGDFAAQTRVQYATVVMPIFTNFAVSQAEGNGSTTGGIGSRTAAATNGTSVAFNSKGAPAADGARNETKLNIRTATQKSIVFNIHGGTSPAFWIPKYGTKDQIQVVHDGTLRVLNTDYIVAEESIVVNGTSYEYWKIKVNSTAGGNFRITSPAVFTTTPSN